MTETPSETPAGLTFLDISPAAQTFPAGACVSFYARTDPATEPLSYRYWVERMPPGLTAYFQGSPAPYQNTLVLDTSGMTAPGSYGVRVGASRGETAPVFADIALNVTSCSGSSTGVYAESIQSNLVALFTAGKPAIEHGLLVPLQVCASDRARRLKVTLQSAISEAGTPMTTPPRFYIFRSLVWPAPANIQTHNWGVNATKAADATGWQLELEIGPGLWLLVFEHDRYGSTPDPGEIPASVMYRLEIVP